MFYTYPSNRMENLVYAFNQISKASVSGPFTQENILVQHPGMKHWLSMAIASQPDRQLCMNVNYPLPVRFFWDLIRMIIGKDQVPERSVYSREILSWRLYELLNSQAVVGDPKMAEPTHYWHQQPRHLQASRRFQLAEQLADLYEQYLMFRPDWIDDWESGVEPESLQAKWQAGLWRMLVAQQADHPLKLIRMAMARIENPAEPLPKSFYLFGINSMAPIWLDFLQQISEKCNVDIHLFYLNPSAEHWDEIRSEKQLSKLTANQVKHRATSFSWEDEEITSEVGNPLLASLGYQGQAFVRLLSDRAHFDTSVFSAPEGNGSLHDLQRDILQLKDGRGSKRTLDNSLTIASAHSAFREVQALHDWLLHRFNDDPTLTPKDVVVMCPNIEDYAPFVHAVFAHSFADIDSSTPPLPCSVADRNLKDAEPTVAAFLELLSLPDARFEVSQILSWLRVPAIMHRFDLIEADLQTIEQWLVQANIHWSLDANHKQQWIDGPVTDHFTWKQGLHRLLLGFAWGDETSLINDQLLLPDVEGSNALLLGKLIHILEQLENARSELNRGRTPGQWQQYLSENLRLALLSTESEFERSNQSLLKVINDFTEFANRARLENEEIPLSVVRNVMENAFASPEQTVSQFMTGQITVCSMVPMRSIPFKVVALLGLNDGEFPRNRPPLGFDLMAHSKPRLGDRSRRGDDRYMFLEAILSARQALYLSYQGFDIRNNEERPPSLVLEELFDYLASAFSFSAEKDIHQIPLQPFSAENFHGDAPSFNAQWLRLMSADPKDEQIPQLPALIPEKTDWHLNEWIHFFTHPPKYFAEQRLGLYLHQNRQQPFDDIEPFALSHLDRYVIQADSLEQLLFANNDNDQIARMKAGSELPLHAFVDEEIHSWQQQARDFGSEVQKLGGTELSRETVEVALRGFTLSAAIPKSSGGVLSWRLANFKDRDLVSFWLNHLLANCMEPTASNGLYRGKDDQFERCQAAPVDDARQQLQSLHQTLQQGMNQPLLLNASIAINLLREKNAEKDFDHLWFGDDFRPGLIDDPYIAQFWQQRPDAESVHQRIYDLYGPMFESITLETVSGEASDE